MRVRTELVHFALAASLLGYGVGAAKSTVESDCLNALGQLEQISTFDLNECAVNVQCLINEFGRRVPEFSISRTKVLLFYPTVESGKATVLTFGQPLGRAPMFYHVALQVEDKVFDPTFSSTQALPLKAYLRKMFLGEDDELPEPDRGKWVEMKSIPAMTWRRKYPQGKSPGQTVNEMVTGFISSSRYRSTSIDKLIDPN